MDFWQTRHKSYGKTLDKTPITLANSIMIWSWFFSKLLIMKNTYTGYTWLPGKKKCTSLKQFLKQQTTRRNHMGTKWNDSGHWSVEHLQLRLYFWDKQNIHDNTWLGITKKTVQTDVHCLSFKSNNFPKESLIVLRLMCFKSFFFSQ